MVATTKNVAALGVLTGLLAAVAYYMWKEAKKQPKLTVNSMMQNIRNKSLDGLGVGKNYTFPRNSMPKEPSFVKEV